MAQRQCGFRKCFCSPRADCVTATGIDETLDSRAIAGENPFWPRPSGQFWFCPRRKFCMVRGQKKLSRRSDGRHDCLESARLSFAARHLCPAWRRDCAGTLFRAVAYRKNWNGANKSSRAVWRKTRRPSPPAREFTKCARPIRRRRRSIGAADSGGVDGVPGRMRGFHVVFEPFRLYERRRGFENGGKRRQRSWKSFDRRHRCAGRKNK